MLAVVWFAFASSASAGQGSDAPANFDGRRLQLTTDSFASYFIRGTDTTLASTVVNVLTADGKLLTRIYTSVDPLFSHYDTIIDRRDDFRPVAHRSYSGGRVARLDFDSTAVKGWMRLPNGDSVTVNAALPPVVYNGASFDLIVRASDVGEGFRLSLPAFQMGANVVATMQGRVTGSDTVDGRPCWVFRGDNAGIPLAFWIDKAGHPGLFAWSLRDSTRSIVILIHVYKGFGGTEGALRRFAREMAGGFTPERGWQVLEDSAHSRREAGRLPQVSMHPISARDEGLDFVRDGLRTAERPQ